LTAEDPGEIERLKRLGLQPLSELFIHLFGRPQFTQAITEALYSRYGAGEPNLDLHEMILEIPFAMVISTNWDDLFELAGRQLDPPVFLNSITTDEELLSLYTPYGPMLIQPRGSLRKGNAVVAEHTGYAHDWRHPGLCAFLRALFFTHRILFIGFGDKDPGLLYYYQLLEAQLGDQAGKVWARSYVFAPAMARAGVERLQQMGMHFIECFVSDTGGNGQTSAFYETAALECFLRELLGATRSVVNRVGRSRRIADFMRETEHLGRDLRARAGLSPIGLPEPAQLDGTDRSAIPPYLALPAEYKGQIRMKNNFLHAIHRAVGTGHTVKLILSTDFESIQDRAVNKRWVRLQLQNLADFFENGMGKLRNVQVVDRQGPFEMQQYIFGDGELAESVKLDVHDPTYYYARTNKDPREAKAAAQLFDVCFATLASRNLQNLLGVVNDPGRDYLINEVCRALSEGQAERVVHGSENLDPEAAKLADELRSTSALGNQERQAARASVGDLLGTSLPHVAMNVLSEEVVYQAIKRHLIGQWKQEIDMFGETRPSWIIQLTDRQGNPKGELDKQDVHRLCSQEESDLFNLHVAAFALTSDAQRVILRKRHDHGPYFDPGKWDRTFTGHVRKDSNYSREFASEVLDHFESCGVRGASIVGRAQFMECCRQRARQASRPGSGHGEACHGMEMIAFPLHGEPVSDVYDRLRADDSMEVKESARSMLYLCIMPQAELPREDPKHFADWAELTFDEIGRMLSTESPITCTTVIAGKPDQIGPATMTREAWRLLQICHAEVLSHL
jgi:hypothetical protein